MFTELSSDLGNLPDNKKAYWLAFMTVVADLAIASPLGDGTRQHFREPSIVALNHRASQRPSAVTRLQDFDKFVLDHRNRVIYPGKVRSLDITPELLFKSLYVDFNRMRERRRLPLL